MPAFTPPTIQQGSSDFFFGRYSIPVGQSVLLRDGSYATVQTPALMEVADLAEGEEWFQGGRTYVVSQAVADALVADGYEVS